MAKFDMQAPIEPGPVDYYGICLKQLQASGYICMQASTGLTIEMVAAHLAEMAEILETGIACNALDGKRTTVVRIHLELIR